jgi:hypothetical protein
MRLGAGNLQQLDYRDTTILKRLAIVSRLPQYLKTYPELALVSFCVVVLLSGYSLGLPLIHPDTSSIESMVGDYLLPLIVAAAAHLMIVAGTKARRNNILLSLGLPTFALAVFCHFQFKTWMPLVNPHRFGPSYEKVDLLSGPIITFCVQIQHLINRTGIDVAGPYQGLFLALFLVSFTLHAVYDNTTGQRQLMLGVGSLLALGGVSYWIAPALGPFIFRSGVSIHATALQHDMVHKMNILVATGRMPPSYCVAAPAAMPSLHVAQTLFMVWMMRRISPWLSLAFVPFCLWICTAAIALAWHYVVDIPAGILLAWMVMILVSRSLPEPQSSESRDAHADATAADSLVLVS